MKLLIRNFIQLRTAVEAILIEKSKITFQTMSRLSKNNTWV